MARTRSQTLTTRSALRVVGGAALACVSPLDSRPKAAITSVAPNIFLATGGDVFRVALANVGGVFGATIAGVACTAVSFAAGVMTATAPAWTGGVGGTAVGQTIAISTDRGVLTSAGNWQNAYYLPSTNLRGLWLSDAGVAADHSRWSDRTALAHDWVQATPANRPTTVASFNGTPVPAIRFDSASSQFMTSGRISGSVDGVGAMFWLGTEESTDSAGSHVLMCLTSGGAHDFWIAKYVPGGGYSVEDTGQGIYPVPNVNDTLAHRVQAVSAGVSNSLIRVDLSLQTGNQSTTAWTGPSSLMCWYHGAAPAAYAKGNVSFVALYDASSLADRATVFSIMQQRGSTS